MAEGLAYIMQAPFNLCILWRIVALDSVRGFSNSERQRCCDAGFYVLFLSQKRGIPKEE